MTTQDPRDIAADIGRLTGREDLANEVLSGGLGADTLAPMLAGMIDGVLRQVFGPIAGVTAWTGFDPTAKPTLSGTAQLPDGSTLTITVTPVR